MDLCSLLPGCGFKVLCIARTFAGCYKSPPWQLGVCWVFLLVVLFFPVKISSFIRLSNLTEESSRLQRSAYGNGTYPFRTCKLSCRLVMSPGSVLQITLAELPPACPLLGMRLGRFGFQSPCLS